MSDSTPTTEEIRILISDRLFPLNENFAADADLYAEGLDSMALMQLILGLEQEFGVQVLPEDLDREHFKTLQAIAQLVETKRNGGE
ncbi:hypothetical protein NT6N_28040 [Oceaniferula spumae]|uniref:Carrier domain-containing protein n=1 Tax=Oceaniferula spumae TaxID=2979115 RepID=A0AAT9FP42_9BACT